LITIPHPSFHGGVGHIFKVLRLNELPGIEYFYNTKQNKSGSIRFLISMCIQFARRIRNVDVIHLNPSLDMKAVGRDSLLLFIAKLMNKKVVVFIHGWDDEFEKRIASNVVLRSLFCWLFSKADSFLLLGQLFHEKLLRLGVKCKMVKFVPTVADDSIKPEYSKEKKRGTFNLLFIAGFVNGKGMDIVLESFDLLKRSEGDVKFKLTMAGDGPELENCKKYVADKVIPDVSFKGHVSGLEKHDCFQNANILFFPSYYAEGLPCVILEAMLYGLPVVTRPVGAIPYWVKHEINGWLSDSKDPSVFAAGIQALTKKVDVLESMRQENIKLANENFTPDKLREKLTEAYSSVN
jgi:glycosyltransferase involved in cell wall biosynthesis